MLRPGLGRIWRRSESVELPKQEIGIDAGMISRIYKALGRRDCGSLVLGTYGEEEAVRNGRG